MKIFSLKEIQQRLDIPRAVSFQEEGFKLYSSGKVNVPPVGYLNMGHSDVHIKYGWIEGDENFVVKIAGSYPGSTPSVQGAILVLNAHTGAPVAFLQDEGYLTNLRTALAGRIVAKHLAPKKVSAIGILGTGTQARLQAMHLRDTSNNLVVWGRNPDKLKTYIEEMTGYGFNVRSAYSPREVCQQCNLIITTTSSREPLIWANDILRGTHITAVGADAPGKQELDPQLFKIADLCVVDSKSQCLDHGESYHAFQSGLIASEQLQEIGECLLAPTLHRQSGSQITLADLTGVAVQDIQIAKSVLHAH